MKAKQSAKPAPRVPPEPKSLLNGHSIRRKSSAARLVKSPSHESPSISETSQEVKYDPIPSVEVPAVASKEPELVAQPFMPDEVLQNIAVCFFIEDFLPMTIQLDSQKKVTRVLAHQLPIGENSRSGDLGLLMYVLKALSLNGQWYANFAPSETPLAR